VTLERTNMQVLVITQCDQRIYDIIFLKKNCSDYKLATLKIVIN